MDIITYFGTFLAYFLLFLLTNVDGVELSEPRSLYTSIFPRISILSLPKIKNKPEFWWGTSQILPYCPIYIIRDIYCAQFMHSGGIVDKIVRPMASNFGEPLFFPLAIEKILDGGSPVW